MGSVEMGMETKVVGMDGDVCMWGRLRMDTELAGIDGDGDECTSPCTRAAL